MNLNRIAEAYRDGYIPPPDLTVSEWADEYRRLSPEASAEPGRWETDRAPYQRGILDALNDSDVHTIIVMSSAQVGKTEILLNMLGYFVHQDPAPILCLQPTLDMAEAFSKDRLAPMVRDTPALRGKIADPRSRDSGNTLLHKKFPGGHITMAGANSPASLASRPIRVVLCDEVDRYPVSAATEGDPVSLARKRTTTFWNRKIVLTSTPTLKGFSRIEQAYEASDQRHYHVPCPHCGDKQVLSWDAVKWSEDKPEDAAIACKACGTIWSEGERQKAVKSGEWIADASSRGIAGFHLSELYSPWSTPASIAIAFLDAKDGGVEQLKTWTNTSLGQSWEEDGETLSGHVLMERCEPVQDFVPEPVRVLTIGVDVQADRLEAEVVGWGAGQESWSIEYLILPGDPSQGDVWSMLSDVIGSRFKCADERSLPISCTFIDSGYLPKHVYDFCRKTGTHVVPTKGVQGMGRPIVETSLQRIRRLRKRRVNGVKPELIGTDEGKLLLFRRLRIDQPGPGYCHFPADRDAEYFEQLTAEKLVTRYKKGRQSLEWIQQRSRNEALDCRVLAHAALLFHGADKVEEKKQKKPVQKQPATQHSLGDSWLNVKYGWQDRW